MMTMIAAMPTLRMVRARLPKITAPNTRRIISVARNADGTLGRPTALVANAHKVGLDVTPWTFRAENQFLPVDYRVGTDPAATGRMGDEVTRYFEAGVDGVFCDQPDICVEAREDFLAR